MAWFGFIVGLIGAVGVGGLLGGRYERRHASDEADKARTFTTDQARADREHASGEARAQRLWAFRLETYGAASLYLERQVAVLAWTDPVVGPAPEPPSMEPDDEWLRLGANVAIGSSDTVRSAMQAAEAHSVFSSARTGWHLERDGMMPAPEPGSVSPRQKMDEARTAAIAAIRRAQTAMRDELESM